MDIPFNHIVFIHLFSLHTIIHTCQVADILPDKHDNHKSPHHDLYEIQFQFTFLSENHYGARRQDDISEVAEVPLQKSCLHF